MKVIQPDLLCRYPCLGYQRTYENLCFLWRLAVPDCSAGELFA